MQCNKDAQQNACFVCSCAVRRENRYKVRVRISQESRGLTCPGEISLISVYQTEDGKKARLAARTVNYGPSSLRHARPSQLGSQVR